MMVKVDKVVYAMVMLVLTCQWDLVDAKCVDGHLGWKTAQGQCNDVISRQQSWSRDQKMWYWS
jgi:hypothetical protein